MSLAVVYTRAQVGVEAPLVGVEVHLSNGLPGLAIVGLPEAAVKESKDRVRGALLNSGLSFPARRITVNLAPADLPKEGGRFDLPIALGLLAASQQIPPEALAHGEFLGELGLGGELRAVKGVLPAAAACGAARRTLFLPAANGAEAALVQDLALVEAKTLGQLCQHLRGEQNLPPVTGRPPPRRPTPTFGDLRDVRGQHRARRALEIAAAGGHHLLFMGPPGTGKTLLASRLPGILPPLSDAEALESAAVRSVSGNSVDPNTWGDRPFRAPHHTASGVALVGGGSNPRPGEISLAHLGVLFLDELPEFQRRVLEVLREPLESGSITISRAARQATYPARFQLVAAMNPCPCGYHGDPERLCHCGEELVRRYRGRLSGPLLDRIDLQVEVPRLPAHQLRGESHEEDSSRVQARVVAARELAMARGFGPNASLTPTAIEQTCGLGEGDYRLLEGAMEKLGLSPRAYHRILKVARTIADLQSSAVIQTPHLSEAIGYRQLDRGATRGGSQRARVP